MADNLVSNQRVKEMYIDNPINIQQEMEIDDQVDSLNIHDLEIDEVEVK